MDLNELKHQTLKHYWGYAHFRDDQEEIIDQVIARQDVIALLPTGGGKSLCFQLPALIIEGTCLVVSPLLALMKDQVQQLKNNNIEAELLSSELDDTLTDEILSRCREGITKILYISPERLNNAHFLEQIREVNISFIAVDEAHCISEWGQDFRPSYQNIKNFKSEFNNLPCIALTATATPKVLQEIESKLELKKAKIFKKSFKRANIKIITDKVSDKYQRVLDFIKVNPYCGIIYTRTRKEAEELAQFLQKHRLSHVDYYHAGLSVKDKNDKQRLWVSQPNRVLVATNAFGMGINKEDVRFVLHFSTSASLENYYQEIGRAGRDQQQSIALLLWNDQEINNLDDIVNNQTPNKNEFIKIVTFLYSLFQVAEYELPENTFEFKIQHFRNIIKISTAKILNVINFMHHQELLFFNNTKSLSTLELKITAHDIDSLPKKDAYFLELLLRNLAGLSTHKIYFNEDNLAKKITISQSILKERLKELESMAYVDYVDGSATNIKFLKERNDRQIQGHYWNLFFQIQKNKIKKWEEMKFYIRYKDFCKMGLILKYFGEKTTDSCHNCSYCDQKSMKSTQLKNLILDILRQEPQSVDQLAIKLSFFTKQKILENLILLLDMDKIKMLDFKTYTIK